MIVETEHPPDVVALENQPRLRLCPVFTEDFRIRRQVYKKIEDAIDILPPAFGFIIYEAYRPLERQKELWKNVWNKLLEANPGWDNDRMRIETERWVANPYTVGSGHQTGAAIDVTLFETRNSLELDMGTAVQEFNSLTKTNAGELLPMHCERRMLLRQTLETVGMTNYPEEWWHFSYGDRLWAELTNTPQTMFAAL